MVWEPEEIEDPAIRELLAQDSILVVHDQYPGVVVQFEVEIDLIADVPVEASTVLRGDVLTEKLAKELYRLFANAFPSWPEFLELAIDYPACPILLMLSPSAN